MGSKSKKPKMPDYTALANQQAELSQKAVDKQTQANRPNQVNQFGSMNWSQDPQGNWTQTTTLNPQTQGLFDSYMQQAGQSANQVANQGAFNPTGAGSMQQFNPSGGMLQFNPNTGPVSPFNNTAGQTTQFDPFGTGGLQQAQGFDPYQMTTGQYTRGMADQYADNFTQSLLARVTPQQGVDRAAMETKLRLQGLQPGTPAYDRAYKNLLTSQGDVNAQAALQGMLYGNQESRADYNTMLGYDQQAAQTALQNNQQMNAAQQQQFGQAATTNQLQNAQQAQQFGQDVTANQLANANQQQDFAQQLAQNQQWNANQQQGFNQQLGQNQQWNANQQQAYDQMLQQYLLPYQTSQYAQSMMQGLDPSFASFMGAGQGEVANILGAAQQTYAQQMENAKNSKGGSLGGIAGSLLGSVAGPIGTAIGGKIGGMI